MLGGAVDHLLGSVDAQAVEMKFPDPVGRVGGVKLAYRGGIPSVEIDGLAPLRLVAVREVVQGEASQKIADRSQVIVNPVQDDPQAGRMGLFDEAPEIIGQPV